jgi:hypothetical protein
MKLRLSIILLLLILPTLLMGAIVAQTSDMMPAEVTTGTTTRVSVASDGTMGNNTSWYPSISAGTLLQSTVDGITAEPTTHSSLISPAVNPFNTLMATARSLDISHVDTASATIHIVDNFTNPSSGVRVYGLPALINNLFIYADGTSLSYSIVEGQDTPLTLVQITVPPGTVDLKFEYEQLDGTLAFEGEWFLALYDWVWGPVTINVHLPVDAAIIRYDQTYGTLIEPQTVRFDIPQGIPFVFTVVYTTTTVPNLYYTTTSEHFNIILPQVYNQYEPLVRTTLEFFYHWYSQYMGYDLNTIVGQSRFDYYFPPGGWHWWNTQMELHGGLCVVGTGPCAVNRSFLPAITLGPDTTYWLSPFGYIGHELGHGWQGVIDQGQLPWWINEGEGYPSFLFNLGAADMGLCPLSENAYLSAYTGYQDYLVNPSGNHSLANIVIATNLQIEYGWGWLQDIHTAIQDGSLDFSSLPDQAKTDEMILFLSESVGEDLTFYFDQSSIFASQWVRDELADLPSSNATIQTTYICPPVTLGIEPLNMPWLVDPNSPTPPSRAIQLGNNTFYDIDWNASELPSAEWLFLSMNSGTVLSASQDSIQVTVDATDLAEGVYETTLTFLAQSDIGTDSTDISIQLEVRELNNVIYLPLLTYNTTNQLETTIAIPIQADNQDGFEDPFFNISGDGHNNNWVGTNTWVVTGWIFPGVSIPQDGTITDAYIRFRGWGNDGTATSRIEGFAEDSAAVFAANGNNKPSTRPTTVASVDWTNSWPFQFAWFQTPDLSAVMQEIVDRPGWASGNNVGFIISNPSGDGGNWAAPDYAAGPYQNDSGGGHSVTLYVTYLAP